MCGSSACEKRFDAQYGTAPRQKKIGYCRNHPRINDVTGNFQLKPGLHACDHGWCRMAVFFTHALHGACLFDSADRKDWIA
jgi:hypothetical protein